MRGRSPYNRPEVRKDDVFRLLVDLGGRTRWSQLERRAREAKMGPTTLKRVLDEMEKEGTIYVQATRRDKGPEVWYTLQLTTDEVWRRLQEKPVGARVADLHKRLIDMRGDPASRAAALEEELPGLVALYGWEHTYAIERAAREESEESAVRLYGYIYSTFLVDEGGAILGLVLAFREEAPDALKRARELMEKVLEPIAFSEKANEVVA